MSKREKHLSLRIDEELLKKFSYAADYDGRSMNGALLFLIRKYVSKFEAQHGEIKLPEED